MSLRQYLPSLQLSVMVVALATAGALVAAAQYATHPGPGPQLAAAPTNDVQQEDWQTSLEQIQASSGVSAPAAPSADTVGALLQAAKSPNLTGTIARSLLVSLTAAKAQGLGDDIPTQDKLIADAAAQVEPTNPATTYSSADLTTVPQTNNSLHVYGNAVLKVFATHPDASANTTLLAIGYATDYRDASKLKAFPQIGDAYIALARDLAAVPTPQTLVPLHLQITNDIATMAATYPDMAVVIDDPLRGLKGFQEYQAKANEISRVLTTIAGIFDKNGILFTKDEPGAAWSVFLASP